MEAFFPAYLQSASRPDPRKEVSPSVKIINNRHCRQLGIPTPPTTKRRHQHFADFHHLTSWCDPESDILLLKYIYISVFSVAWYFCTNPGWPGTEDEPNLVLCLGWGWSSQSLDMRPHDMVTVFVRKLCYSLNQTLSFVHNKLSFPRAQLWWSDTNSEQRSID